MTPLITTPEQRETVLRLFEQGIEQRTIAIQVTLSRRRVKSIISEYLASKEGEARQERSSRPPSARSKARAEVMAKKKEQGLCIHCDTQALPGGVLCERHRQYNENRRKSCRQENKCVDCGEAAEPGRQRCQVHAERAKARSRFHHQQRKALGLCTLCGKNPAQPKRTLCQPCLDRAKENQARKVAERLAAGLCKYCGKDFSLATDSRCTDCFFKGISQSHFGTNAEWQELRSLFQQGGGRCPYSGRSLVLGQNAVLDHIIPIARGGPYDISNVHWVDSVVNQMKRDLTEEEFFGLIGEIFRHRLRSEP